MSSTAVILLFLFLLNIIFLCISDDTISINDFKLEKFLGSGAYGAVYLVTKKTSRDLYAMKVIDFSAKVLHNNNNNKIFRILHNTSKT